jgi:hypothetical protein
MNHDHVEENQIADLYLMGRLDDETAALFEEHYLGCGECLEHLELGEGFQAGLRRVAAEDVAKAVAVQHIGLMAWLARAASSPRAGLLAAAMLAILVLPLGVLYQQERGTSAGLAARLEESLAPQGNVPIVSLGTQRGAPDPAGPVDRIRLPGTPGRIVLSLNLPDAGFESYGAVLLGAGAQEVWRGDGLLPDQRDALAVSLHSSSLEEGDYTLLVEGQLSGEPVPVARFAFRVLAPR